MPSRIVLFGATGHTGGLTAEAVVARGARMPLGPAERLGLDAFEQHRRAAGLAPV